MKEVFLILADYIKGKSVYPAIRRCLNLLFNISISSSVFEHFYGRYSWSNYNDYKNILDFFVKGYFFIPFSIFIGVWALTQFLSLCLFNLITHFKSIRTTRNILNYEVKKEIVEKNLSEIEKASEYFSARTLSRTVMLELYENLKKEITPEAYVQLEESLKKPKENLEVNFTLACRSLIAITIFFLSIEQFSWILYLVVSCILLCSMYIILLSYRLLDIFPVLIRKFHSSAEKYLSELRKEKGPEFKN